MPVAVFAVDGTNLTRLARVDVESGIPSGTSTASLDFEIALGAVGSDGIAIRFDDNGAGFGFETECDEDDNDLRYTRAESLNLAFEDTDCPEVEEEESEDTGG